MTVKSALAVSVDCRYSFTCLDLLIYNTIDSVILIVVTVINVSVIGTMSDTTQSLLVLHLH